MKKYSYTLALTILFSGISLSLSATSPNTGWTATFENKKVFTENKGQFSSPDKQHPVLYAFDDGLNMIYFTKVGVSYSFTKRSKKEQEQEGLFAHRKKTAGREEEENQAVCITQRIAMNWEHANPDVQVIAEGETPDYRSYVFREKGEMRNVNNIRCFTKLRYQNLYPHIDVEYVFHPVQGIKYSLIVHPGADLSQVSMAYEQHIPLLLKPNGDLHIPTRFGDIVDHAPLTYYQDEPGTVIGSHFNQAGHAAGFILDAFDPTRTLVIDPWTATPAMPNCNKVWEVERDGAGNA
ncbi:MAG TPA: hypothetical protein VNZ86_04325, partial [Bacteroidia bacterium]|nr:hypothetical protein [Bacteroidia bacterium]